MATETAEPRTGLLAGIAVTALITLVGIRFGLQSYYLSVAEAEQLHKIGSVTSNILTTLRESEEQRLGGTGVAMSINDAITRVASGSPRPGFVAPAPSTDFAALQGWLQRPVNLQPPPAPPVVPAPPAAPIVAPTQPGAAVAPGAPGVPSATGSLAAPPAPGVVAPAAAPGPAAPAGDVVHPAPAPGVVPVVVHPAPAPAAAPAAHPAPAAEH